MENQKEIELNLITKFKEYNYECNIIINDEEPYTLYQANQIGKLLDIKNIVALIRYYNNTEKKLYNYKTKGGNQNIMVY